MKHIVLIFSLFALMMCGCSSTPKEAQTYGALAASLDTLFQSRFASDEPGACVIVTLHDSIIYDHSFGMALLPGHENTIGTPITDETMFNICSVSKQFSAIALLKLAEEGKIFLDDPVKKYFPNFQAPFFEKITLANLLSHTSGLPDDRPRTEVEWKAYIAKNKTNFSNVQDFKKFCEVKESVRFYERLDHLVFQPGSQYEYQNPTFQLAELIVEQVTGQDFEIWMKENIFGPAGMHHTLYFTSDKDIQNLAHGYQPVGFTTLNGDKVPSDNPYNYWRSANQKWEENDYGEASFFGTKADGGIYTTPLDFLRWDRALYHDVLVGKSYRKKAHTSYIQTDIPETGYGYGFFIEKREGRPEKIYHTGDNGGFLIYEGRIPELDVFYLIFANRPDWDREETVEQVDQILLNTFTE